MAFVVGSLADDGEKIVLGLRAIFIELRDIHSHERVSRMRSGFLREIESPDYRIHQIRFGGVLRTFEQLVAIDDLDYAALGGSVARIDAIACWTGRNGAMHVAGLEARRT